MSEFNKLVAIVTGGASGIGAATAELLLERGAHVAVLDRDVGSVPGDIFGVQCDITNDAQVQAAVEAVASHFGGVDVVINNAGIGAAGDITANTDEEWHRVLDVNVVGIAASPGRPCPTSAPPAMPPWSTHAPSSPQLAFPTARSMQPARAPWQPSRCPWPQTT